MPFECLLGDHPSQQEDTRSSPARGTRHVRPPAGGEPNTSPPKQSHIIGQSDGRQLDERIVCPPHGIGLTNLELNRPAPSGDRQQLAMQEVGRARTAHLQFLQHRTDARERIVW